MATNCSGKRASFPCRTLFISKMKTAGSSETLVASYQNIRSPNSEVRSSKVKILKFCFLRKFFFAFTVCDIHMQAMKECGVGLYIFSTSGLDGERSASSHGHLTDGIHWNGGFCGIIIPKKYYFLCCLQCLRSSTQHLIKTISNQIWIYRTLESSYAILLRTGNSSGTSGKVRTWS
jgi:hypothetical protein